MAATIAALRQLPDTVASAVTQFTPRSIFPTLTSLPRSYYLGHHKAGLDKMKTMLNQIDLVIECRDYRIPLTSRNPLLEEALQSRDRIIVYTKYDLGVESTGRSATSARDALIRRWHAPTPVHFSATISNKRSASTLLAQLKKYASTNYSLTGHRILVAGMPNVGKSTLLNSLRASGMGKGKAAKTGAQPGITRKISSAVKVVERSNMGEGEDQATSREGIYVLDTPGVFMPYVSNAESMLKLALCGAVKDSIISPLTLADYLLFRLNLHNPSLYTEYVPNNQPTNDVTQLVEGVARKTGRLGKGGVVDVDGAAMWLIQRWRAGLLGRFLLDAVDASSLKSLDHESENPDVSVSHAKKLDKEARREKMREKGIIFRGEI